jgi:hypothetical protein
MHLTLLRLVRGFRFSQGAALADMFHTYSQQLFPNRRQGSWVFSQCHICSHSGMYARFHVPRPTSNVCTAPILPLCHLHDRQRYLERSGQFAIMLPTFREADIVALKRGSRFPHIVYPLCITVVANVIAVSTLHVSARCESQETVQACSPVKTNSPNQMLR